MINNRTTRRTGWRGSGVRLASGALVTGAVIAVGAGHIEVPSAVESSATRVALLASPIDLTSLLPNPADQLNGAIKNLTDATQLLSQADLSQYPNFAGLIGNQIASQGTTLSFLGSLQSSEDALTSHSADIGQTIWLYLLNLGWVSNSSNLLSLAHVVDTGLGNNLPGLVGLANFGLFLANLGGFGQALLSLPTNFAALQLPSGGDTSTDAPGGDTSTDAPSGDDSATGLPAPTAADDATVLPAAALPGLPTLTPQAGDSFLELIQKIDGSAFTQNVDGLYQNNDIIGTIAMQMNLGFAANQSLNDIVSSISSQVLAGDWASELPVTTNFFEEFVTNVINPNAFIDGLPAFAGDPFATVAYQLDDLLANTVYATDLNDAALLFWP